MSYSRIPQSFMKGIFVAPHSFSDPQNPKHGQYVNMQLKNDLYYSAIDQISKVQFSSFGNQDQWVKVQEIQQCKGSDPQFSEYAYMWKKSKGRVPKQTQNNKVQIISCQDWKVALNQDGIKTQSIYRVKILQTQNDIFRSQIYPPTFLKVIKDLLLN